MTHEPTGKEAALELGTAALGNPVFVGLLGAAGAIELARRNPELKQEAFEWLKQFRDPADVQTLEFSPDAPTFEAPEAPTFEAPTFEAPETSIEQDVEAPSFEAPTFEAPQAPEPPDVSSPQRQVKARRQARRIKGELEQANDVETDDGFSVGDLVPVIERVPQTIGRESTDTLVFLGEQLNRFLEGTLISRETGVARAIQRAFGDDAAAGYVDMLVSSGTLNETTAEDVRISLGIDAPDPSELFGQTPTERLEQAPGAGTYPADVGPGEVRSAIRELRSEGVTNFGTPVGPDPAAIAELVNRARSQGWSQSTLQDEAKGVSFVGAFLSPIEDQDHLLDRIVNNRLGVPV